MAKQAANTAHCAPPAVIPSQGTEGRALVDPNISCVTYDLRDPDSRDDGKTWDYFDVRPMDWEEGNRNGIKIAWEVLKEMKTECAADFGAIYARAHAIAHAPDDRQLISKRGAAIGFICTITSFISASLEKVDLDELMITEFKCFEDYGPTRDEDLEAVRRSNAAVIAALSEGPPAASTNAAKPKPLAAGASMAAGFRDLVELLRRFAEICDDTTGLQGDDGPDTADYGAMRKLLEEQLTASLGADPGRREGFLRTLTLVLSEMADNVMDSDWRPLNKSLQDIEGNAYFGTHAQRARRHPKGRSKRVEQEALPA